MNTDFKRIIFVSAATVAVAFLSVVTSPAYAQRDAGAKARGEFGTTFSKPTYRPRSYATTPDETRQSFSYEPAGTVVPTETVAGCHCGTPQMAAMQPQAARRSYSYEPSYRGYPSYRAPKKAPWQYPKTDPRRYQP
jgi:hypothetical protein